MEIEATVKIKKKQSRLIAETIISLNGFTYLTHDRNVLTMRDTENYLKFNKRILKLLNNKNKLDRKLKRVVKRQVKQKLNDMAKDEKEDGLYNTIKEKLEDYQNIKIKVNVKG